MIWRAITSPCPGESPPRAIAPSDVSAQRESSPSSADELGAAGPVADLPAGPAQLVTQAVGLGPVLLASGFVAALSQRDGLRRGALLLLKQRLEPEHGEHLAQVVASHGRLRAICLAHPVEQRGECQRGVEVVAQRLE